MGFESQEEAEAWAEQAELAADRRKEERMLNACRCRQYEMPGRCPGPANCPMCETPDDAA